MVEGADDTPLHISPRYTAAKVSPGTFPDWVDVWEDRMWGWWLTHADSLRGQPDGAFVMMHLGVGVIEALEVAYQGKDSDGNSGAFFRSGFVRIFSGPKEGPISPADAANILYKAVRCALTHSAMLYGPVFLTNDSRKAPIEVLATPDGAKLEAIVIHPEKFLDVIILHLRRYVNVLRTGEGPEADERRKRFEVAWHELHARTLPPSSR